jgi:hypothetical protein
MTDKELLELAAKAAGLPHPRWNEAHGYLMIGLGGDTQEWNPLTDDGDALRLAVKLGFDLRIKTLPHAIYVEVGNGFALSAMETLTDVRQKPFDIYAATRRAIVRAAATIGRNMP